MKLFAFIVFCLSACVSMPLSAHTNSDSLLSLTAENKTVSGNWAVAVADLHALTNLDQNGDGNITWSEVKQNKQSLFSALDPALVISSSERICPHTLSLAGVEQRLGSNYVVFSVTADCPELIEVLGIDYNLLFSVDANHRGLLGVTSEENEFSAIFSPSSRSQRFDLTVHASIWAQLANFIAAGAVHVWIGLDHILFLLCLLLPAVVWRQRGGTWVSARGPGAALKRTLWLVTSFTVAHAFTLTWVLMSGWQPDIRWVESLVALSVGIAALNNIFPLFTKRLWLIAFAFGLIHGAAIATVLAELRLGDASKAVSILGFNLGVEFAQIAIALIWIPLAFLFRNSFLYRTGVVIFGSVIVFGIACVWFYQRAFS